MGHVFIVRKGGAESIELTGNALPEHVVSGETFYTTDPKTKQTGTMTDNGTWNETVTPGNSVIIPHGFHSGNGKVTATNITLSGDATTSDVLKGKTFYNDDPDNKQTGTLELNGNASESYVLEGRTFYTTDPKTKQTGAMTSRGAWDAVVDPGGSITIPAGYHNGSGKVTANAAGYPGLPSGYKYLTGTKTMEEVNAAATIFPMSATFSGGTFTPAYAEEGTGQVKFGTRVLFSTTISGGGWNYSTGSQAYIDIFAACGRSFSTLMSGNQQLSLSGFSSGTLTVTAWIEPV